MKITKKWLTEHDACSRSYSWYLKQKTSDADTLFKTAIAEERYADINWVLILRMNHKYNLKYFLFAVKLAVASFEKLYPPNRSLREGIEVVEKYLEDPSIKTKRAVHLAIGDIRSTKAGFKGLYIRDTMEGGENNRTRVAVCTASALLSTVVYVYRWYASLMFSIYMNAAEAVSRSTGVPYQKPITEILNYGYKLLTENSGSLRSGSTL